MMRRVQPGLRKASAPATLPQSLSPCAHGSNQTFNGQSGGASSISTTSCIPRLRV